tara:strand:+ start:334 stop:522 length:189 start_codon:yes stop_codon:yes gene_type:complete
MSNRKADIMLKIKMVDLETQVKDVLFYHKEKQWALLDRAIGAVRDTSILIKNNLEQNERMMG